MLELSLIQVHPHFFPHLPFSAYSVQENVFETCLNWAINIFKVYKRAASYAKEHVGVEKFLHVGFWGTKCLVLANFADVELEMKVATRFRCKLREVDAQACFQFWSIRISISVLTMKSFGRIVLNDSTLVVLWRCYFNKWFSLLFSFSYIAKNLKGMKTCLFLA